MGADLGQIVKSLVFVAPARGRGLEPIVCLVSGPNRVDVARLAAVAGEPEIRRATAREANELTGFAIGGIPPIGHERPIARDHGPGPRALSRRSGPRPACRPRSSRSRPATLRILVERDGGADRGGAQRAADAAAACLRGVDRLDAIAVPEPRNATITYPGGLRARWRWGGSGQSRRSSP